MAVSLRDPLTGALSRAEFRARLDAAVSSAVSAGHSVTLMVIDLDHFKSVNDAFGHTRGDEVLTEFATRILNTVRPTDLLFRFGGDEFAIILPHADKLNGLQLAHRVYSAITGSDFPGNPALAITISIGASTLPDDANTADALFEVADSRLYTAKREGRARVVGETREEKGYQDLFEQEVRLLERDSQLAIVQNFLEHLPHASPGLLTVRGAHTSGRTRFLSEIRDCADLLGFAVVALAGGANIRGRALGAASALRHFLDGTVPLTAPELADALEKVTRRDTHRGVILTLDDAENADDETLELLSDLLAMRIGVPIGIAATTGAGARAGMRGDAALVERVALDPLRPQAIRSWLRQVLHWEPPVELVEWLHAESEGMPGAIRDALYWMRDERFLETGSQRLRLLKLPPPGAFGSSRAMRRDSRATPSWSPAVHGGLIGRDRELSEAARLLRDNRLVTITGPGGVGKTRLALQLLAERTSDFRSGGQVVPLSDTATPELVATRIAEILQVPLGGGQEPVAQLRSFLRAKQMLLVLDNFEHVIGAAPLVEELLSAAPELRVVVTSREKLHLGGEEVIELEGMPVPADGESAVTRFHAAQLFLRRARQFDAALVINENDLNHVARICRAVGGLPLAIEMAASLLRVISCRDIAAELEKSIASLSSPRRGMPERHRTLRAVFDYSWARLTTDERRALAALSVFRGPFTRVAAERAMGVSVYVLASLVDRSWLRKGDNGRFEIHEVFRQFAEEHLLADPSAAEMAERGRCAYCAQTLESALSRLLGGDQRGALADVSCELANARAAWRWASIRGESDALSALLEPLFRFYSMRGWYLEGHDLFTSAGPAASGVLAARLLVRRAWFAARLSRLDSARALLRASRAHARVAKSPEVIAQIASVSAYVAYRLGRLKASERLYRSAARGLRASGTGIELAEALDGLGITQKARGDGAAAERSFRESLELRKRHNDRWGLAKVLNNMATMTTPSDGIELAEHLFGQSLEISREFEDRRQTAVSLHNLALVHHNASRHLEARGLLEESLEIFTDLGVRDGAAGCLHNLGEVATALGELNEAETRFEEALRVAEEIEDIPLVLEIRVGLASLLLRRRTPARAGQLLLSVMNHPSAHQDDRDRARAIFAELPFDVHGPPTREPSLPPLRPIPPPSESAQELH